MRVSEFCSKLQRMKDEVTNMKKKLVKPSKKKEVLKKAFLFNTPKPTNENCNCCTNPGCTA